MNKYIYKKIVTLIKVYITRTKIMHKHDLYFGKHKQFNYNFNNRKYV